jgi:cytochrome c553
MTQRIIRLIVGVAAACGCSSSLFAAAAKLDPAQVEFFEKKVRPVLANTCYKCHSAESEKLKGGLLVDSRDSLLKGGDSGPAIVPGNPDKSLLIKAVRYTDKDLQMPPKDQKLPEEQIADLVAWVKMGAPDPREPKVAGKPGLHVDMEKAKKHWAFQPVANPPVPKVSDSKHWVQSPIDSFVLAKLHEKGMEPSAKVDKRTLIRRATYDLTGLPPAPEEVEAFVADKSPDAFAKVVDRLLASPHYGERWGRHWLDVARYADTTGDRQAGNRPDPRFPYAWTYRDYVIDAFNRDLPYDQFILQQIAADKLPLGENKSALAAMGFLTVGKRFMNNINDVLDDRIDVVTRGLMGLTASCARCHDHKFDPIPTKDYYSLHGVFASSVEPGDEPLIAKARDQAAYQDFLNKLEEVEAEATSYRKSEENKVLNGMREKFGDYLLAAHDNARNTGRGNAKTQLRQRNMDPAVIDRLGDRLKTWRAEASPIFKAWFAFADLTEKEFSTKAKKIAAEVAADKNVNPLIAQAFANRTPSSMKEMAEIYTSIFAEANRAWNEIASKSGGDATAPLRLADANQEALRDVLYGEDTPLILTRRTLQQLLGNQVQTRENAIRSKATELKLTHPGSPARAMVLEDTERPRDSFVMIRGEPGNRGPVVPRQFLEILSHEKREPFKDGSGRLDLAKAIASRDNPLTARAIVNRVWQHHFGEAIVRTPSDFGLRSEPPTHPEMLDYLATWFMDNGWSLKKLHRFVTLSSVYQQSSQNNDRYAQIDPANLYLWRMNLRRLDFEEIRDSLLALGGQLDLTMGGPPVKLAESAGNARGANRRMSDESGPGSLSLRRAVYGMVDRLQLPELFRTFDFADPDMSAPTRYLTTVPQQALFLMNSDLVVEQARRLVERSEVRDQEQPEKRIQALYRLVYQREPTATEAKAALHFVKAQKGETSAHAEPAWKYGFGSYNENKKRVAFQPMPMFANETWFVPPRDANAPERRTPEMEEKIKRFMARRTLPTSLTAEGGVPGPEPQRAVIRRWIAPRDGVVVIEGTLVHTASEGDGVQGRVVSSRSGELGKWTAHDNQTATKVARAEVKKGDTIDFITDGLTNPENDAFTWSPVVQLFESDSKNLDGLIDEWKAKADFAGPPARQSPVKPLTPWEKFAQVLLLTNELIFVN